MSKKPETKFTFDVAGIPRCVFNTAETSDGTIILNLLPRGDPTSKTFGDSSPTSPLAKSYISIHPSDKSTKDENFIKLTRKPEVGPEVTSVICTTAIKQWNTFSPVFSRRFDDIRASCYDIKSSTEPPVTLAKSQPLFTPVVTVFAGPPGRHFQIHEFIYHQDGFQVKEQEFTRFTLLFMWSFILLAPKEVYDIHLQTTREGGPVTFGRDIECVPYFHMQRNELKAHLVQRWRDTGDRNAQAAIELTKSAPFFREARIDTPQFAEFDEQLRASGRPVHWYVDPPLINEPQGVVRHRLQKSPP